MPDTSRPSTLLWIDANQAAFAHAVAERAGLRVVGVAVAPGGAGEGPGAAELFPDAAHSSDLRATIARLKPELAVLLTARSAEPTAGKRGPSPAMDGGVRALCDAHKVRLVSLEPTPGSLDDLRRAEWPGTEIVPLLARSRSYLDAVEAIEELGAVRTAAVTLLGGATAGSLGARLFDAMHLLHGLLGTPESIDAAHAPVDARVAPPGATAPLAEFVGDMTANLRFAGARAASVCLSSRGGQWFRGLTLLGEHGRMRLDERGFEIISPDGETRDASSARAPVDASVRPAVRAVAEAIARTLDRHAPPLAPVPVREVLAMCEAATLSAQTGQAESPQTVLAMMGG
jgi:hypothetical protein